MHKDTKVKRYGKIYFDKSKMDESTHIADRHLRVMVLMGFWGGFAVEHHGLMGAEVDAGEALGAVAAAAGLSVGKGDVALRAYLGAEAAAYTLVGVDRRGEHGQRAALHSGEGAQGSRCSPPGIVAAADTGGSM